MENIYFLKLKEKLSSRHIKIYDVTINIVKGTIFIGNGDTFEYEQEIK